MPLDYRRSPERSNAPYTVKQTPRGSVVICGAHLVTDELKPSEAYAMARALNVEHQMRTAL